MAMAGAEAEEEAPIAAFAVAKAGILLKHIFLNPPPEEAGGGGGQQPGEEDPPVRFGRHPDCHVLLDHPSVSRFHLEVRARRRRRRITVTDLSSVHGTWVSGRRIPPNTPVELAAGDTLRLGCSKREYRLHWVSLRQAFEMEDPLPPLLEEDREELRICQEASKQMVPAQWESVETEFCQETNQQIVSEQSDFCAEPSAPPLPEFAYFSLEESSISKFDDNREGVIEEKSIDENSIKESVVSSIIQAMPSIETNSGRQVQSDKSDALSTISRRAKLKPVKPLRVDTGRRKERSSAPSYNYQKEKAQSENVVCSENCGGECAACCMVLFDNSNVKNAEEKEKMILNSHVSDNITMEVDSKEYMHCVFPLNLEHHDTFSDKENSLLNVAKETESNDFISENYIPQDSVDASLQKRQELLEVSPSVFKGDALADGEIPQLDATIHIDLCEPVLENSFMQDTGSENTNSHNDMKYDHLPPRNLDRSFSNKENVTQSDGVVIPEDCKAENSIFDNLFENLDTKGFNGNEERSPLDKENTSPYVSGNIIMESSHLRFKPTITQDLMDSISPLELVGHDNFSDNENIGKLMKSDELFPKNLAPQMSVDADSQMSQTAFMPILLLDFEDGILLDKENSLAPGKYDAISPARQGDIFSDKENVTPVSKDLKSTARRVLGSMMSKSVSTEYTKDRSISKPEYNGFLAKSKKVHTVDDDVFYSDKENLTPVSSGGMKARRYLPKNLTVDSDQDQETFYSDKENLTPASSAARKTRNLSENRARIESVITKKRVVDRLPFQTLLSNSPLRHSNSLDCKRSNARAADFAGSNVAIRLEYELNDIPHKKQESDKLGEGMKIWTMVADTNCLLDDESRNSLMLLQGLKGTHLIIPMIVIRELNCMKQREGLFMRSSKATSILQWIDECMEKESRWIHVQRSSEMLPVAPTPPATPTVQCYDEERHVPAGTFNPMAFFSRRSFSDIVSPKTEDRILDCALLFKKLRSNHNVVILSTSITLKIKSMAEGLLCEDAKEFRETLMNPCSGRFMWAASAPRGSAWSCLDEATLAENYYNSHHGARGRIPRPMEASAKGLKLVLLHSSVKKTPLAPLAS